MLNESSDAARLKRTLAKTTAAALAVSRTDGRDVFGHLAARLAEILEVDAAMIARFDDESPGRAVTLAAWLDGRLLRPFDYDIDGTPCRSMVNRESRFVGAGVHSEYTPGTLFHAQGFDSYAAHSMSDGTGRQVGLIVAMHRQAMSDRALTEALLQIFAVRAAAELEHQRTDAATRALEASYRAIFNAAEDAIFVHDLDTGRVIDVNPKACRSYGYTHDELLQVRIGDVSSNVPPYTEVEAAAYMEQARRGAPVRFEWHRRNKDGSLHWDEVVLKRATIGGHERILAFIREITDRKSAHEALRLREEQYRAIFEGSADALVLWSRDIRIVDVNAAFTAMYGYTREEILGSTFGDRLPALDVARRIRMMQRAIEGETGLLETRTIRKSGEAFDVEIRYLPIRHRGEPHVLAIARDITERRSADQRLKASEARYRMLFEMESAAVVLVDVDSLQLVDVNLAAVQMYGYPREQLLRMTAADLSAEPEATVPSIRDGNGALNIPLRWHRRKDGSTFPVEITANRLELDGRRIVLATIRDITERKRAEQALRDSEEQYRAIFNASVDALILWNSECRRVDVNPAYQTIYGWEREEVIGHGYDRPRFSDDYEKPRLELVRRALAGESCSAELETFRKDGARILTEVHATPFWHRGEPHALVLSRDITERKRAEEELRASEEQYRAIFEAAADSLQLIDAQHRVVDVNPAYEGMYGKSRDEVVGKTLDQLVPAEYRSERRAMVERALAGEAAEIQTTGFRSDGSTFELEVRVIPFRHRGQPHVLGIARDITARKRAEQALRDSEEQYRAIFNASADALVLRDADFRIVDVNATYEAMSGYPRDVVLGVDRVIANPPEDAERIQSLHARALAGEPTELEATLVRRDGARYNLELRGVPIQHRGAPHVLYMGRDVTARKREENRRHELESQLRQAQKMEAIGHLTGGIAHDFNNILTSVMGYMALAAERPAAAADAKLQSHLAQAEQSAHRARDLIQQMLAFSRGRRGEPRPVGLRALVTESTRMLRATLPATVELVARVAGNPVAEVDPVQAHQLLLNLCINARDAMDEAGRIVVSAEQVRLTEMTCSSCRHTFSGSFAQLSVSDSGAGIGPEVMERMFEPFFSTKDIGHGTGMGLSIVHGVVHEHGGHVLVESRRGVGTTFRVLLPLAAQDSDEDGSAADTRVEPRSVLRGQVLLVEDEQSVLGFMRELLQGWGLTVVGARNPVDALDWFAREPERFDAVLTDHTMPVMTGLELARALIARRPDLPVLLYSGRSELLDAHTASACGVRKVLSKPVDARALHAALGECLASAPA